MSISSSELALIYQQMGCSIFPITGGSAGSLKSPIAQTMPTQLAPSSVGPATGVMGLSSIFIPAGQTISNINYITTTAATGPTHYWYALYDDGRGSTTAGQMALLGMTGDQLTAAVSANTMIGLSLVVPWVTQYTGIYYVAVMCSVSTTAPGFGGVSKTSASFALAGGFSLSVLLSATAGSGLTYPPPNPSGALSNRAGMEWAYVS